RKAEEALKEKHEVHNFLVQAFGYRIQQALDGKAHGGPLPQSHLDLLADMGQDKEKKLGVYAVDRLRQKSRILEPDQRIEAVRHYIARSSDLDKELAELPDVTDRQELTARVARLLKDGGKSKTSADNRARVLKVALDLAPRVGEDFALGLL